MTTGRRRGSWYLPTLSERPTRGLIKGWCVYSSAVAPASQAAVCQLSAWAWRGRTRSTVYCRHFSGATEAYSRSPMVSSRHQNRESHHSMTSCWFAARTDEVAGTSL